MSDDPVRVAFVCVQNAGRSQMSTAFAKRERERRGLTDDVEILTGGTHPADEVHEGVVAAMADAGFDIADRTPREITTEELERCDYVATMGCSTLELAAEDGDDTTGTVDVRDWDLPDPDGEDPETVRQIRETVAERVRSLFDEIAADLSDEEREAHGAGT